MTLFDKSSSFNSSFNFILIKLVTEISVGIILSTPVTSKGSLSTEILIFPFQSFVTNSFVIKALISSLDTAAEKNIRGFVSGFS